MIRRGAVHAPNGRLRRERRGPASALLSGEDEVVAWSRAVTRPDPMSAADLQALLDAVDDDDEPWSLQEGTRPGRPAAAGGTMTSGESSRNAAGGQDQARAMRTAAGGHDGAAAIAAVGGQGQPGRRRSSRPSTPPRRRIRLPDAFDAMPVAPSSPHRDEAREQDSFDGASVDEVLGSCPRGTGRGACPRPRMCRGGAVSTAPPPLPSQGNSHAGRAG